MTIELGMLVPRMCHEDQAPKFLNEIIEGMHQVARVIEDVKPDGIVMISSTGCLVLSTLSMPRLSIKGC